MMTMTMMKQPVSITLDFYIEVIASLKIGRLTDHHYTACLFKYIKGEGLMGTIG